MRRLVVGCAVIAGVASASLLLVAQDGAVSSLPPTAPPPVVASAPEVSANDGRAVFQRYCFECHGTYKPEANLSIERLLQGALGPESEHWEKIADAIESEVMPPSEALEFPTDAERRAAATWVRGALRTYADAHAGDPVV